MADLKPCPFCKSKVILYKSVTEETEPFLIKCPYCDTDLYGATEKEVVDFWNKRI